MSEIKTPLTYGDAMDLWRKTPSEPNDTMAEFMVRLLMAVDVASREQERERCARLAETDPRTGTGESLTAILIRDPENL